MRRARRLVPLVLALALAGNALPAQAAVTVGAPVPGSTAGALSHGTAPAEPVVADVGPVPGVLATRIHWTRWSTLVPYGARAVLEGQVVTDLGAIAGATVRVLARPVGSTTWQQVGVATSDDAGAFRFNSNVPSRTTDYLAVFDGDLLYARSEGGRRVAVARTTTSTMTRNTDGTFTFTGKVSPGYAGRTVRLERRTSATGGWSTIASVTTSSTSTWRFRVSGPSSRGTWSFRAVVPADGWFAAGYSGTWSVTRS